MLHIPTPRGKKREILLVYGQRGLLEYWWPLALELNRYGSVTMPDLPGFGGMQSFYKLHEKPTIDNLASYLAAFVKLRYKHKRVTIVGVAFGFVVLTRMLERFPDLAKKVDIVVGIGGLAHRDDVVMHRLKRGIYRYGSYLLSTRLFSIVVRNVFLHPALLQGVYARRSLIGKSKPNRNAEEDIWLWRRNDIRTHFFTMSELTRFDNCGRRVELPLWHVALKSNKNIDHHSAEQRLRVVFSDVQTASSRVKSQSLGTIDFGNNAAGLLPATVRQILN